MTPSIESGSVMRDEGSPRRGAERRRRVEQRRDRAARMTALIGCTANGRLYEDRREDQRLEREGEAVAGPRRPQPADGAARSDGQQDVEAEHRRRQHERQRDDGLDQERPAPAGERQPVRERQGDAPAESPTTSAASLTLSAIAVQSMAISELRAGTRLRKPASCSARWLSGRCEKREELSRDVLAGAMSEARQRPARSADRATRESRRSVPLPRSAGASASDSASSPASALPDCANCAACEMFSPSTNLVRTRS